MNFVDCYTRDQLQDFLLGKLPDEKSSLVAQHLDHCDVCEDTIVGLESASDTLVNLLLDKDANVKDGPIGVSTESESLPEFRDALSRIQNLDFDQTPQRESAPQVVQRIGEYEIGQQIASGGMGSVYRARHMRLEKTVAIKVLPERKMQNADAIARFSREMKIIGQMDHPSMVRATDAGDLNGTHFLVMELVEGLDLGRIVRLCGRLTPENAAEVVRSAAIGLHYAHERDVVHRDVKPSNLMLNRDGAVKILDLGLATLGGLNGAVDELTTVGQLMGTLDYMAPEQCGNNHQVDARTDIYGLGATLYKLLTGSAPYSSPTANTPLKKLKAMAVENPTPILDRRPDLSPELAAVVDKCLEQDPSNRFQTAHELSVALEPFATGHVLKSLLNTAEKLKTQQGESAPLREPVSIEIQPLNANPKPSLSSPDSTTPQLKLTWFAKSLAAVTLLLAAGVIAWGGITIYLNTVAGRLIIESDIDNINVSVVENEKPKKEIRIEHGPESTRLWAGKYRLEILGQTDGLVIDKDRFELKRGETVVVKITKRPSQSRVAEATGKAEATSGDAKSAPNNAVIARHNEIKLAELRNAADVAKVKLEFASEKFMQFDLQYQQGDRQKEQRDQALMEKDLAKLEFENANRLLNAHLKQVRAESDFEPAISSNKYRQPPSEPNAQSMELIDLEYALKAAEITLEQKQRQLIAAQASGQEALEAQTVFELAELNYDSARAKLDAAKAWIEKQSILRRRELEDQIVLAEQELDHLQTSFDRSKQLVRKGFVSESQLRADEFNLSSTLQKLNRLKTQLFEVSAEDSIAVANSNPDAKTGETASNEESEANQPTYKGETLRDVLSYTMTHAFSRNRQNDINRKSYPAIQKLLPVTSIDYLERLFNETISKYENEVSLETQCRVIFALSLLCDVKAKPEVEALADRLLKYALKVGNRSQIESFLAPMGGVLVKPNIVDAIRPLTDSQFDRVQQFLLATYADGSAADKTIALNWLFSLTRSTGGLTRSTGGIRNDGVIKPAILEKWVPLLIKDTENENPSIASFATQVLALQWGESRQLIDHFAEMLRSDNPNVWLQAVVMLAANAPETPGLAEQVQKAVEQGISPEIYVDLIGFGGVPLIEQYLSDPNAGQDVNETRADLFRSIAERSKEKQLPDAIKTKLAAIARAETKRETDSTKSLYTAWEAYSALTGQPTPKLYKGYDLEAWQKKMASSETPRQTKLDCLKAIKKLDNYLSKESLSAIAAGLRGGDHESKTRPKDLTLEYEVANFLNSGDPSRSFLEQIDTLAEKDLTLALFVLRKSYIGNDSVARRIFDFIAPYLDSSDPMIRRRSTNVLCELATAKTGLHNIRNEISRQLVKTIQSDRNSIEHKLATIATSRSAEPNLIDSLSGSFDPEKLKPQELVSFLQLAGRYNIVGVRTLCLQLLAKNPDYLDEAFEPIDLDLWFVPTDVSPPDAMNARPEKPIDQILEILDKIGDYLVLRSNESDESILALRKAATKTLQKRLKTTTGINKKKIERAIERLTREPIQVAPF